MATSETPFKIRGLIKRYGETTVFDQLSFHIAPGECLSVIGLNRAGKTTTIRTCLGLTASDAGSISYFSGDAGKAVLQMLQDELGVGRQHIVGRGYWKLDTVNHPDHDYGESN